MRIVGQYKGCDVRIIALQMSETYGGLQLGPSNEIYETVNWELINVGIPQRVGNMWGRDKELYVMGVDYKKRLPGVEVIVRLESATGTKEGDNADIVLAWFQEADEDPFEKAGSHLKMINWEEKSQV